MLVFPQLSSGAVSQLPLGRETLYRTLVNAALDGREIRVADPDYFERNWELPLELLTDIEWQAIQDLFTTAEGRLRSFLFLEPGENLLAWSEGFGEAAWVKSGVTVTGGVGDPWGGGEGSQLSGAGTLSQTLATPAWFRYAASIWARTTQAGSGLELRDGGSQVKSVAFTADGAWRRYLLSLAWVTTSETVTFRVVSGGAATLDLYGAQLEAQPLVSNYKKTLARGGVHSGARFATDTLSDRATGPGEHSSVIRVSWTPSQT